MPFSRIVYYWRFCTSDTIDTSRICFNRHIQRLEIEVGYERFVCQPRLVAIASLALKQIGEVSIMMSFNIFDEFPKNNKREQVVEYSKKMLVGINHIGSGGRYYYFLCSTFITMEIIVFNFRNDYIWRNIHRTWSGDGHLQKIIALFPFLCSDDFL